MVIGQVSSIPLAKLKSGQKARVIYTQEYGNGFVQHLADMGLNEGSEIEVVAPGIPGPFLITIGDTSLALGRSIAERVMVEKTQ